VADVALRFGATDDGLTAQFRRVSNQLSNFERESNRVGTAVSGTFARLGSTIAGIAASGFAVREVLQFADGLTKAAAQTGIAVESLQRLQFIAGQVGASTDSITRSITRLQVTLVSAGEGSAQAAQALGRLGIPVQDFINLAPDEQFQRVAQQLAGIQNPAERAAAAVGLFGRGGAELLPVLVQTGEQLETIQGQLSGLGGTVSESAVVAVDDLGDALGRLKIGAVGLGTELLALVAGPLTTTLDTFNELIGSVRILAGGGGELEQLNRQIDILSEARDSIPIFFNFGYVDSGGLVLGKSELDKALDDLIRKRDDLRNPARAPTVDLSNISADIPQPDIPDLSPRTQQRQPTPEELRNRAGLADTSPFNQLNVEQFELQEVANQAHLDRLLEQQRVYAQNIVLTGEESASALALLRQEYGIQEINFEELKSATIQDIQSSLALSGLQIATAIFGQNKKVAIAVAALNIAVGATEALKLPYPANILAVAKVLAQGAQLMSRIRSANIGSGGVGGVGGGAGGGVGSSTEPAAAAAPVGASERTGAQIYITGYIGDRQVREMVDALRKEMDRDVVIIPSSSRQAIELRGA
jgi:hypothetical protein